MIAQKKEKKVIALYVFESIGNDKIIKEKCPYIFYGKCRINKDSRNSLNDSQKIPEKGNCVVCFREYSGIKNKGKMSVYFLW